MEAHACALTTTLTVTDHENLRGITSTDGLLHLNNNFFFFFFCLCTISQKFFVHEAPGLTGSRGIVVWFCSVLRSHWEHFKTGALPSAPQLDW